MNMTWWMPVKPAQLTLRIVGKAPPAQVLKTACAPT
jgi:hypothetical protein